MSYNVVLIEPEIPNNTGNIGRLCLGAGATLHLVKPFGFELSDSRLKRAGLDYWQYLDVKIYESKAEFFQQHSAKPMVFLSSKASKPHYAIPFEEDLFLIFGKESKGLGELMLKEYSEKLYKIPLQNEHIRSLNLANAVAIVLYEGLRNG